MSFMLIIVTFNSGFSTLYAEKEFTINIIINITRINTWILKLRFQLCREHLFVKFADEQLYVIALRLRRFILLLNCLLYLQ
ncbi:Pantothenate kinase [Dirofilaria immitis]